jgi:hypothetical protein
MSFGPKSTDKMVTPVRLPPGLNRVDRDREDDGN